MSTPDWRDQLRRNNHRTQGIIALFIFIYFTIGLLIDVIIHDAPIIMNGVSVSPPVSDILNALFTFQIVPYATLTMVFAAIVSLWISYTYYDRLMLLGTSYTEITPETARTLQERQLYNVVDEMKVAAGLNFMPRVFLIDTDTMNAFASGYSERSAMVAITRGLLEKLDRAEMQAVMAHELSHVRHQDIKVTLMASLLANLILIVIDLLFRSVIYGGRDDRKSGGIVVLILVLRFLLPVVTMLLMLYLSRTREYMADAGCVELMRDNVPLAKALIKIHEDYQSHQDEYEKTPHEEVRRAAYLYDPSEGGVKHFYSLANLFSTHPSLEQRLAALGYTPQRT